MDFREWLGTQNIAEATINSQIGRIERIRQAYPDIDDQYDRDGLAGLMSEFVYSAQDERDGRQNPTRIEIDGNVRKGLATYRATLGRYMRYKRDAANQLVQPTPLDIDDEDVASDVPIGFERDMQRALRINISQLEVGLSLDDDGVERRVESGFIDITARDRADKIVVIELKTGVAGQRAVAQILSYMGDVVAEEDSRDVRGILVAFDFDKKAVAAAKMVPALKLMKYRFRFEFEVP